MEKQLPRKLAAILYADVAGYSRLTGEDEEGTHLRLSEALDTFTAAVNDHQGNVVHFAGDAILAEFATVSDALICAAAVQRELATLDEGLAEERKVQFRIGVNLGEVIVDRDDIYGEGVNVAARLEGLAEPGGICVSGTVYDAIGTRLPLDYDYLGEQHVKNIAKPVRAYHARLQAGGELPGPRAPTKTHRTKVWFVSLLAALVIVAGGVFAWLDPWAPREEPASIERMAFPLPAKPSIAVLPFTNMSGDPEQEYFSDGMTEDLITDLSKISGLFVISRNSTFTYKGKPVKVQQVAEDLGVRYVLEGSVRRVADQVRINVQLIDATTGGHLWAERYDDKLDDVFALQDAITEKVVQALELHLTKTDKDRRSKEPRTASPEAYDLVLQARKLMTRFSRKAADEARGLLERAIEVDPGYAEAHTLLGLYHFDAWRLWGRNRNANLSRAVELGRTAIELNPLDAAPHVLLAQIHQFRREFDAANSEADAALALGPNDAVTLANLGSMLRYADRAEEAADVVERAIRLDPYHPPNYLEWLADAYFLLGRDDCKKTVERGIALEPDFVALHVVAAKCYASLGEEHRAREAGSEVLRNNPRFTLRAFASYVPFSDERVLEHNVDMLRKAGIPE